jgi:Zn-dependent M32 family carboxypeptidase
MCSNTPCQVKEILIQNLDLIKDLEKTEHLLKIQQKMTATLKAEAESNKQVSGDELAKLRKVSSFCARGWRFAPRGYLTLNSSGWF